MRTRDNEFYKNQDDDTDVQELFDEDVDTDSFDSQGDDNNSANADSYDNPYKNGYLPDEEDTSFEEKFDAGEYDDYYDDDKNDTSGNEFYDSFNGTYGFKIKLKQNKHPSIDELIAIMKDYHSNDLELQNKAIVSMMNILDAYIHSLIKEQYSTYEQKHLDDLTSEAYKGLMQGMENYDPLKGTPTTWFSRYIKHSMQEYINTMVNHSTPHYTQAHKQIAAVIARKEQEGKQYSTKDLCLETGLSIKTVEKVMNTKNANNALPFESKSAITESLKSSAPDPEQTAIENDQRECLFEIMKHTLSDEEQLCILHKFGFDTGMPETPQEISDKTGIPKQNVRKIINSALAKLEAPVKAMNENKKRPIVRSRKIGVNTINRTEMHQMIDELYDALDSDLAKA